MPTDRLTPLLETRLQELSSSGRLKGAESVTVGMVEPCRRQGAALPYRRAR